jgi:hypothetical protein
MGFVVFMVMGVYLLISLGVVTWAVSHAKKNGLSVKKWGWGAALVMYLIPFWDWIPTVAVHQYYCAAESGFWVYKTLDQWKAENPGVMETLVTNAGEPSSRQGDMENYVDTYFVNQRINLVVKRNGKLFINRWRHEREVVDTKNNTVLARYIDFSTSQVRPQAGWSGWKFWLDSQYCIGGRKQLISFGKFYLQFKGAEG